MPNATTSAPDLVRLDRLIESLEEARAAVNAGCAARSDAALIEALDVLGVLYGSLAPDISPEATAQLEDVYDTCIRSLGEAYRGVPGALLPAIVMVRAIHTALAGGRVERAASLRQAA